MSGNKGEIMIWDVIIIGGGPAGLAAAGEFKNKKVLLLEKMHEIGLKLKLSGAGQCNITHSGSIKDFESKYGGKYRFVRTALDQFSNMDLIKNFESQGLKMVTLENGKVFPRSLSSSDVIEVLKQKALSNHVEINTNEWVKSIHPMETVKVVTNKNSYEARYVVVATGGISYPKTGSTGDAFKMAKELNIEVIKPHFALSPVYIEDHILSELSGLSFKDVSIEHFRTKKIGSYTGDLLITHFGYSGPVILNNSRYMKAGDELIINFTHYKSEQVLEDDLLKRFQASPKKSIKSVLQALLYNRLAEVTLARLEISEQKKVSEISKRERKQMVKAMVRHTIEIGEVGKSHIAMVTAGGIKLTELNKKSYMSKTYPNLAFVGECVDVDGDTGGYNIQFAFSSGVAAARKIMEVLND